MADEFGEKTDPASAKRRSDLWSQGNIPKSTDLAGVVSIAATIIPLIFLAQAVLRDWSGLTGRLLSGRSTGDLFDVSSVTSDIALSFQITLDILVPFMLIGFGSTIIAMAAQVGLRLTWKPLQPRLSKLNPIEGAKKFVDLRSAMRLFSSLAKVIIVLGVAVTFITVNLQTILVLPKMETAQASVKAGELIIDLCLLLLAALFVLALIDLIYQRWQWERDNRMSKQELREEAKNIMGDPKNKKRQREFAMSILNQRTAQTVPQADVIVTNPEHLSIALKWDPETMNAPKVLAKGADYMALRIRQIAIQHGIPIVERKPLARAMYPVVHPGYEIPSNFFAPVAEILAYVYRLEGKQAG